LYRKGMTKCTYPPPKFTSSFQFRSWKRLRGRGFCRSFVRGLARGAAADG